MCTTIHHFICSHTSIVMTSQLLQLHDDVLADEPYKQRPMCIRDELWVFSRKSACFVCSLQNHGGNLNPITRIKYAPCVLQNHVNN